MQTGGEQIGEAGSLEPGRGYGGSGLTRAAQQHRGFCRTRSLCFLRAGVLAAVGFLVANCSGSNSFGSIDPRYGVSSSPRVVGLGESAPKGGGAYRVGAPYTVAGRTYTPQDNPNYRAEGVASWYGSDFHGRLTANGEVFDMQSMSAAHPTLPLPSYVRVTNLSNHKSVIVRVNDRGPYSGNRLIDVSERAASLLGFYGSGLAPVRVEYVGKAPIEGSDDIMLMATLREGEPAPSPSLVRVASAKGFMPASLSRSNLRDVPTPPDRPYGLGDGQIASNFRASAKTSVASAPMAEPVARPLPRLSAYAAVPAASGRAADVPYASAMRGLY